MPAKVRQRGAALMKAIQLEMPDVKILTLFGMTYLKKQNEQGRTLEQVEWALLGAFIDGMLTEMNPRAELIDGNEPSYCPTHRNLTPSKALKTPPAISFRSKTVPSTMRKSQPRTQSSSIGCSGCTTPTTSTVCSVATCGMPTRARASHVPRAENQRRVRLGVQRADELVGDGVT